MADREADRRCWRVIHAHDNVETVLLVTAWDSKSAREEARRVADEICGCTHHTGCSWSASAFLPDAPYFLYAIDKKTGNMNINEPLSTNTSCLICIAEPPR